MKEETYLPILLVFLFILIVSSVNVVQAEYIRGLHVYLKESPQYQAKNIVKLKKGDEVIILEEKGYWRKIRAGEVEGWLTRMSLVDTKQMIKISGLELKKTPVKKRNLRARVAQAAVGVKGLRESQVKMIEDSYDMKALEKMESFKVDEEEATRFVMEYSE
ncbi:SH3 domain-containing protein [bacterium]|nr:SH3 domain-containing protein [bacterium]